MKKVLLFSIICVLSFSCRTYLENLLVKTAFPAENEIRVKLTNINSLEILMRNDIKIINITTGSEIKIKSNIVKIYSDYKCYLNDQIITDPLLIWSIKDKFININNKLYPGKIKIIPSEKIEVINILPLERYLLSVLPSEMPLSFHIEALKAQAIAARTYAYYHIKNNRKKEFDVDDTVRYQVYKSYDFDFPLELLKKVYDAVNSTKGQIIVYNNEPVITYFHANSGGLIKSGLEYFGETSNYPFLIKRYDPFSLFFPTSDWSYSIRHEDFFLILGYESSLKLKKENIIYEENGFVKAIKINDKELPVKQIRQKIGYNIIKSERFNIEIKSEEIKFYGIGYGHGVGLSQWGALGMALSGFDFKEIINFYYPGGKIKKLEYKN